MEATWPDRWQLWCLAARRSRRGQRRWRWSHPEKDSWAATTLRCRHRGPPCNAVLPLLSFYHDNRCNLAPWVKPRGGHPTMTLYQTWTSHRACRGFSLVPLLALPSSFLPSPSGGSPLGAGDRAMASKRRVLRVSGSWPERGPCGPGISCAAALFRHDPHG
jgi:hypothetical protein